MRLIDADALLKRVSCMNMEAYMDGVCYGIHPSLEYLDLLSEIIEYAPTVDAVPVCRCKDCKHAEHWYCDKFLCSLWNEKDRVSVFSDGFCSYGDRKGGNE